MLAAGWADEVRALAADVPASAAAWNACGYEAVRSWVDGRVNAAEARHAILVGTRQYAKRQRTWFRHQLAGQRVTRLDPTEPGALDRAMAWWNAGETA